MMEQELIAVPDDPEAAWQSAASVKKEVRAVKFGHFILSQINFI